MAALRRGISISADLGSITVTGSIDVTQATAERLTFRGWISPSRPVVECLAITLMGRQDGLVDLETRGTMVAIDVKRAL